MGDKKIVVHFTVLTFCMNIPFAVYILSPAIASYIILRKNNKIRNAREWLKNVFCPSKNVYSYLFVILGLVLYFFMHAMICGHVEMALPFYAFFLSLPGNLFIGGLEEAGWSYLLWPELDRKFGYVLSCVFSGIIWIAWHIPLFFIPGTNHEGGGINFGMFAVQCIGLRFFLGAICKISGENHVFMCVLFHTMFNAAFSVFGMMTGTWTGTVIANIVMIFVSIAAVAICRTSVMRRIN